MNLKDQVVSIELAKKLKDLGVKQDSFFYYIPTVMGYEITTYIDLVDHDDSKNYYLAMLMINVPEKVFSAFTVAELGELLPKELPSKDKCHAYELNCKWELHYSDDKMWHITYKSFDNDIAMDFIIYDKSEANARARMLIYLIENKLMDISNEN